MFITFAVVLVLAVAGAILAKWRGARQLFIVAVGAGALALVALVALAIGVGF